MDQQVEHPLLQIARGWASPPTSAPPRRRGRPRRTPPGPPAGRPPTPTPDRSEDLAVEDVADVGHAQAVEQRSHPEVLDGVVRARGRERPTRRTASTPPSGRAGSCRTRTSNSAMATWWRRRQFVPSSPPRPAGRHRDRGRRRPNAQESVDGDRAIGRLVDRRQPGPERDRARPRLRPHDATRMGSGSAPARMACCRSHPSTIARPRRPRTARSPTGGSHPPEGPAAPGPEWRRSRPRSDCSGSSPGPAPVALTTAKWWRATCRSSRSATVCASSGATQRPAEVLLMRGGASGPRRPCRPPVPGPPRPARSPQECEQRWTSRRGARSATGGRGHAQRRSRARAPPAARRAVVVRVADALEDRARGPRCRSSGASSRKPERGRRPPGRGSPAPGRTATTRFMATATAAGGRRRARSSPGAQAPDGRRSG